MPKGLFIAERMALLLAFAAGPGFAQDDPEPVRGLVRALDDALISTELNARILEITRREGQSFKAGEVLLRFNCRKYETELEAARAEEEFNRIAVENSVALDKRKAIGRLEVEQNRAKYDKAKAQAETLANQVDGCSISAPFDGRIAEMRAKTFEMSRPNEPLMRLVNTDRLEIELIVPSLWLRWLKPGQNFRAIVDETETVHDATVQRIAATVDSVSQTVKIMAVFAQSSQDILPGMSLSAEFKQPGP